VFHQNAQEPHGAFAPFETKVAHRLFASAFSDPMTAFSTSRQKAAKEICASAAKIVKILQALAR
jgi:hypothetical protein